MTNQELTEVLIKDEYITLGQMLKKESLLGSGGEVKIFLAEVPVTVNGQPANQRGKKLFIDTVVEIEGVGSFIIKKA